VGKETSYEVGYTIVKNYICNSHHLVERLTHIFTNID